MAARPRRGPFPNSCREPQCQFKQENVVPIRKEEGAQFKQENVAARLCEEIYSDEMDSDSYRSSEISDTTEDTDSLESVVRDADMEVDWEGKDSSINQSSPDRFPILTREKLDSMNQLSPLSSPRDHNGAHCSCTSCLKTRLSTRESTGRSCNRRSSSPLLRYGRGECNCVECIGS